MATPKDKPKGYTKHLFAFDVETTGIVFGHETPVHNITNGERHQIVSIGIIIVDTENFDQVEDLYLEIKWNENSCKQQEKNPNFGKNAVKVHSLSKTYLDQNGMDEEEAVLEIGSLILKYWGPSVPIKALGHNVHLFDVPFLRDLFKRHGIDLRLGTRHYDSNSLGFGTFGTWNSDDLFTSVGFDREGVHNALEDVRMTVETFRRIRMIFQRGLDSL